MPIELSDIGGVAASFTVTDDFSDTLTRAEVMLREAAKAANAFSGPAKKWSASAAALGRAAEAAAPKLDALAGAAGRAADAVRAAFGIATDKAAEMNIALRRSAAAFAPFRTATTAALGQWNKLDAAIDRSSGLIQAAGDKMAFASTTAKTVAVETAEIAASMRATAKAASDASAAVNRMRAPRMLPAPGGGGGMPPIRPPGGSGDESFGGGSAGGFIAGRLSKLGSRVFSLPALAGGFTAYEALKAALATTYDVTKTAELFDVKSINNPARLKSDVAKLLSLSFSTARGTIFSAQETANAYGILAPILATAPAFQGPNKWENFADLAPIILRASEVAAMGNLGPLNEDMIAMAWYAHLTGAYTPKAMTASSNQLLALAERTGVKLPRLEKIMSYALPVARGLGVNVSDTAMLVGALIQGGLGQRAGYAVGQMITGLLQTGGPVTAALQKALETLGPHGVTYKGKQLKAHQAGLHALELTDAAGRLTVLDKAGHVVLAKVIADIEAAAKRLTPVAFGGALQAAFGIRGTRGAALLSALQKLIPAFDASVKNTPTALQQQAAFAATTQQQLEQVIARVKDVANILAQSILPVMRGVLAVLLPILSDIDSFLGKHHSISTILGTAALGAGIGGLFGGPAGAAIGGGIGAGIGFGEVAVRDWNSPLPPGGLPKRMPGQSEADAGLMGRPLVGQQTNHIHITIDAPGADAPTIAHHVRRALQDVQRQSLRQTFGDPGLAAASIP